MVVILYAIGALYTVNAFLFALMIGGVIIGQNEGDFPKGSLPLFIKSHALLALVPGALLVHLLRGALGGSRNV